MQNFQNILLILFFMSIQVSLQAFGLWQGAGMLLSELNPLYWNVCGVELGAEWLYLKRKDHSENIAIASQGISGPIVLKTDEIMSGWECGLSLMGRVNLQEEKTVELIWQRTCDLHDSAKAASPAQELYSVYSHFGTLPIGGFEDTDGTSSQSLAFDSKIDSLELNIKKHWSLLRGAFLYGYRYQSIDESLKYSTQSDANWYRSRTVATNEMHGFQMGLEAYIPCASSVGVQLFGKGAIYMNGAKREFKATAPALLYPIAKTKRDVSKAWGVDAGVNIIYLWRRNVSFSFGYKYQSFDNVALVIKNFDETAPFKGFDGGKKNSIDNDADLSFHGIAFGACMTW